jgi:hypothetical protein
MITFYHRTFPFLIIADADKKKHTRETFIIYLKGIDITEEIKSIKNCVFAKNLSGWIEDEFLNRKNSVYGSINIPKLSCN